MSIQPLSSSAASMQSMVAREAQASRSMPAAQGVETRPENVQTQTVDGSQKVPSAGELQKALEDVAKAVAPMAQSLEFSLDKDSGKTVVKVMDTETNEVIRQIPSEEVLAISKAVDKLKGLLIKQQA
ncbi:flagellar protein FlaG [Thauera sp. 2A1]|uniref:flagellar protein FlaG n=1 Tax=Thauera sp. 2A1 TaxID=2570191 RepID=UPI00129218A6|nr:flagellar protein FlaG [Thauera sp. 2A1]KAI5916105.1 flagellar protein FlaG [Thauera sp. 2A1]